MKKTIFYLLIFIILITFLSGCIEVDIETGIDENFTSYLIYRITMDVRELDERYQGLMRNALNNIRWHYQEYQGFIVELDIESDPCTLIMTRRIENADFEQAYASLEGMLTNESITPFMYVDMAYQSFERQNRFLFNAGTDIPQIMRLSNADDLPPALFEQLDDAVVNGQGLITISFPASEVIDSTHRARLQNNQTTMMIPLNFTGQTDFELSAAVNLLRDGTPGGTFEQILHEQTRFRDIALYIGYAAVALLIITIIIAVLTRKKKQKYVGKRSI